MRTMLQEKGTIQFNITIWYTNFSDVLSNEDNHSKNSGGQGMGKLEKISAWDMTKVRNKSEVIDEARTSGSTVHFASLMDICHLKSAELETKHQKYKGRVVLRGDCKRRFWILCSIYRTRIISITNDGSKGHVDHIQIARMHRTGSRRSIS